jgi:hypothetical protein
LAHRWRQGCQPYTLATFDPKEYSWYSFLLEAESIPRAIVWLKGLGTLKKCTLSRTQTGDLPACSIVTQPTHNLNANFKTSKCEVQPDLFQNTMKLTEKVNINIRKVLTGRKRRMEEASSQNNLVEMSVDDD